MTQSNICQICSHSTEAMDWNNLNKKRKETLPRSSLHQCVHQRKFVNFIDDQLQMEYNCKVQMPPLRGKGIERGYSMYPLSTTGPTRLIPLLANFAMALYDCAKHIVQRGKHSHANLALFGR
jgi:hypothetical protein